MEQILQEVKNIVFDLGGVLLDIDPQRTVKSFETLGLTNVIKPGGWGYKQEVFLHMEEGKLTDGEFRDGIRELLPGPVLDAEIDAAWCAMLIDFPAERVTLLKQLESKYNLYLFSNTNNIHVNYFHKQIRHGKAKLLMKQFVEVIDVDVVRIGKQVQVVF